MRLLALLAILALPARADTWHTTRAGNFLVLTNTNAQRAVHIAETLERTRAAFAATTTMNTTIADPIRVFVFRSTKDYLRYGEMILGAPPDQDGLSIIHPFVKAILIDGSALRSDFLLQHELTHHFARQTWKHLPLWLDEGLAELYGMTRVRNGVVQIGRTRDGHRRITRRYVVPMREFLAANAKSRWYAQPFLETRFYAQSWLFTHWLIVYRHADPQVIADQFAEHPVDEAIRNLFQMTPAQLQRAMFRYNQLPALPSRDVHVGTLDTAPVETPHVISDSEAEAMMIWTVPLPSASRTLESAHAAPEVLARYDQAVEHVARGELAQALELLDALIVDLPRGQLRNDATKLRDEVAEIVRKN